MTRARILVTISLVLQVRGLTALDFKHLEVLVDDIIIIRANAVLLYEVPSKGSQLVV